jgi:hypothetical protein
MPLFGWRFIGGTVLVLALAVAFGVYKTREGAAKPDVQARQQEAYYVSLLERAKKNRPPTVSITNPIVGMHVMGQVVLFVKVKDRDGDRIRLRWSSSLKATFRPLDSRGPERSVRFTPWRSGWDRVTVRAWDGTTLSKPSSISFCVYTEDSKKPDDCP